MPKVSKTSATKVTDIGIGKIHEDTVDGYEISLLDLREEVDMAGAAKGLPDDLCPCPHWGYVTAGRVTFTFRDHTEEFEAGDAFHVAGRAQPPTVSAGTAYVLFSPADADGRGQRGHPAQPGGDAVRLTTRVAHTGTGSSSARSPCCVANRRRRAVEAPILV